MKTIKAIIVDDSDQFSGLLKSNLKAFNCVVIKEIRDGKDAIPTLKHTRCDIVFLDYHLPNKNGLRILQEIDQFGLHPYVVMMSGDEDLDLQIRAECLGAKFFIQKPYKTNELKKLFEQFQVHRDPLHPLRVYVADDEPLMRKLLSNTLRRYNTSVEFEAEDGESLVKRAIENPPDIVFLDLEMPGMDGFETLKQIKQANLPSYVVIVSAHSSIENIKRIKEYGADGFIVKPYAHEKIRQVLKNVIKASNRDAAA
ncbi:MAG: response regulator [Gammaproteobacteria bacterium]|nr:response regulator [Gammaproteobacteria bacterium]